MRPDGRGSGMKTRLERLAAGDPSPSSVSSGPVRSGSGPGVCPREPRERYPETLQGPERTNVKSAHVTHFYPKNISADHPIFSPPSRPSKYFAQNSRSSPSIWQRGGRRSSRRRCKLSPNAASVKMAVAKDWKTAEDS